MCAHLCWHMCLCILQHVKLFNWYVLLVALNFSLHIIIGSGSWFLWKETWKLNTLALLFSFQGNRLFKEGKFELAKAKYEKACYTYSFLYCFLTFSSGSIFCYWKKRLFCLSSVIDKIFMLSYLNWNYIIGNHNFQLATNLCVLIGTCCITIFELNLCFHWWQEVGIFLCTSAFANMSY